MADPLTLRHPSSRFCPIAIAIDDDPDEALAILRDLAADGPRAALRHGVKSLCLNINPQDEQLVMLDIENDFLRNYPNLRDLEINGFDDLDARAKSNLQDDCAQMSSGVVAGEFRLHSLSLLPRTTARHSARGLMRHLQHTPRLAHLKLGFFAFRPEDDLENIPRAPYSLEQYDYHFDEEAGEGPRSARGWTAPITSSARRAVPALFTVLLYDRRNIEELVDADADFSLVRRIAFMVPPSRAASELVFSDYGVVASRCANLRQLFISTLLDRMVDGLARVLAHLAGSLFDISLVTLPQPTPTLLPDGVDCALAELLEQPPLQRLRSFKIVINDGSAVGAPPMSFPLLMASCHARHVVFSCTARDPSRS